MEGDYNLTYVVEDIEQYKSKAITSQIGINEDGIAPEDTVDPIVYIRKPVEGDIITEIITIIVKGMDDNSGLEDIQLLINGDIVKTDIMPDYLPYPELCYSLDPSAYGNGVLNITAIATDKAGNYTRFSTVVTVEGYPEDKIPGFPIWGVLSVIAVCGLLIYLKSNRRF